MSLEFELQKYPKEIQLKDGSKSRLRPLRKEDEKGFYEFFSSVPEAERMFIKHRVSDPQVIRDWCQKIDLGRNLPLLAFIGNRIAPCHFEPKPKRSLMRCVTLSSPQY